MKKVVLILLLFLVLSLYIYAGYHPSVSFLFGTSLEKDGEEMFSSPNKGLSISVLSWKIGDFVVSLPVRGESISSSIGKERTEIQRHRRLSLGLEGAYERKSFEAFLSSYIGIVDYPMIYGLMRDIALEMGVGWRFSRLSSLRFPFAVHFTQEGISYTLALAITVGGEV